MEIEGRQVIQYRLRKYRRLSGLKQETVRKRLGLRSRCVLSEWENGKSFPSIPHLLVLAKLYHCKPTKLYPDLDYMPEDIPSHPEDDQ